MKLKFLAASLIITVLTASCSKYDDTAIIGRIDDLSVRVSELEKECDRINNDIKSINVILDALSKSVYVKSIVSGENSYTIMFTDGREITINNPRQVSAPVIGIVKGDGDMYYWTVDGQILKDNDGNPICANGVVVTPLIRINGGYWQLSYDGGQTWSQIATVADQSKSDSMFSKVEEKEDCVVFTLSDGTVLSVVKSQAFSLVLTRQDNIAINSGGTVKVGYTLAGAPSGTVVSTMADGGYLSWTETLTESTGYVYVTAPETISNGKVAVIAARPDGKSIVKFLTFKLGAINVDVLSRDFDYKGGEFTLNVTTTYESFGILCESEWIKIGEYDPAAETAAVAITVEENIYGAREASIIVRGEGSGKDIIVKVNQSKAPDPNIGSLDTDDVYVE